MLEITDADFENEVLKSSIPVMLDFWAPWCGPCKTLTPIIEELQKEFNGKVKILKMNIDDNPNTPTSLNVKSIPTIYFFKDGKPISTKIGAVHKQTLVTWIEENLNA